MGKHVCLVPSVKRYRKLCKTLNLCWVITFIVRTNLEKILLILQRQYREMKIFVDGFVPRSLESRSALVCTS